jgi:group I intron endonuclease
MITNPAIYKITNIITNEFYIGASLYPFQRHKKHLNLLKLHHHPNYILQSSYNKFGLENFKFEIITYCKQSELQKIEQEMIDSLRPSFNIERNSKYMYNAEFKNSYTSQL